MERMCRSGKNISGGCEVKKLPTMKLPPYGKWLFSLKIYVPSFQRKCFCYVGGRGWPQIHYVTHSG